MNAERFTHYTTGFKEMDVAHYSLLKSMDKIKAMCVQNFADVNITPELILLQTNLIQHFHEEEELMHRLNYVFIDSHVERHGQLLLKMANVVAAEHTTRTMAYIMSELHEIVLRHIDEYDMQIC